MGIKDSVSGLHEWQYESPLSSARVHRSRRTRGATLLTVMLAGMLSVCRGWAAPELIATTPPAQAGPLCANFDSQIWAQTVFDDAPGQHAALDPDRDDLACEELAPGVTPALWATGVPAAAIAVELIGVVDGDTIEVSVHGSLEHIRLVGVDARESDGPYRGVECFGPEGARYLEWLVGSGGQLFIEKDREDRDSYGRLLRWVWLDPGNGEVYLLNEALVRAGFAERFRNTPNRRYADEIVAAERFAQRHQLGLWSACNGSAASGEVPRISSSSPPSAECDAAYPDVCIPSPPPDLECRNVPYKRFRVLPPDPHNFDGNHDGIACEGPG